MYVPLWVKSHHSFLEGASSPDELVDRAADLGLEAIALTDRNGVYGIVRAHVQAKKRNIRLIVGSEVEIRFEGPLLEEPLESVPQSEPANTVTENDDDIPSLRPPIDEDAYARVVLLPRTEAGYSRMCQALSLAHTRGEKGQAWLYPRELAGYAGELFALSDKPRILAALHEAFGADLRATISRHLHAPERRHERHLLDFAQALGIEAVAAGEVLYHEEARRPLQDVVTCIRHGVKLSNAGRHLCGNAEYYVRSDESMRVLFRDRLDLVDASEHLAKKCTFSLDDLRYRYPAESLPNGETEFSWLRQLTFEGAAGRYAPESIPDDVRTQLEKELSIIEDLEYGGYFLTMHEIVGFCRREEILCQGRGSAANSAVCFCLGITAVDPVRMDLLFERFLSRERAEPPDIDLDIEHERREEVIQHVYEKYGRRHAAMVSNVVRYRARSAIREVGKALGVARTDIDAIARLLTYWDGEIVAESIKNAGLNAKSPVMLHLLRVANDMRDSPRHQSIHPGGFLLGHKPVDHLVPIEPATMEGRTVIQWDKYDVENLGLFKVDLLGLGALTCIRKGFALLREHKDIDLQIHTVPSEDKATYDLCSAGDTVGVFQIESRAQMAMLPRLRPRTFYDLVIQVAIVRPGPIQGDMVHPYLRRRHGEEPVEYPHENLVPILSKTLGVPIFQEQVMKLAVAAANYTPGEADQLRRDMAAWRSAGKIEEHRDRMIPQMIAGGIDPDFAARVFDQIRGFGEYGFPESHAASFALLSYVTAWMRCHHPAVFTCSLLNSLPMGFYSAATLVEDAKRRKVQVLPVCVQESEWDHTLVRLGVCSDGSNDGGLAIRMGFRLIRSLGQRERLAIDEARTVMLRQNEQEMRITRSFADLGDFVRRTRLGERPLLALAESGAFDAFGKRRRDALWELRSLVRNRDDSLPKMAAQSQLAFSALDRDDAILWDYRASGHSARGHPMLRYRRALHQKRVPSAKQLAEMKHGTRTHYVGQVICRQRPQTASGVTFFTLEDETGFVNLVVWAQTFEAHRALAKTAVLLGVYGEVQRSMDVRETADSSGSHGTIHLIARNLYEPDFEVHHKSRSRDFH